MVKNGYNKWLSRNFWIGAFLIFLAGLGIIIWLIDKAYPIEVMTGIFTGSGTTILGIEKWKNTMFGLKQLENGKGQ